MFIKNIIWELQLRMLLKFKISRQEQDKFAVSSQEKAKDAIKNGKFKEEIIDSVSLPDEHPDLMLLRRLKTKYCFQTEWYSNCR